MSNPAVFLLSETTIKEKSFRIEDNLGEAIHIHIGEFRFSVSINEFRIFSDSILKSVKEFLKINSVDLDTFDITSLDWDWLTKYSRIKKTTIKKVKIGDLFTKGNLNDHPELTKIIPLSESLYVNILKNSIDKKDESIISDYERDRLNKILNKILSCGYPYEEKYIMVNQYNQIYDGDHRAACLYYLKGKYYEIPVLEVTFDGELTIKEQQKYEFAKLSDLIEKKHGNQGTKKIWSEEKNILPIHFDQLIAFLTKKCIDYYIIDYPLQNENKNVIADMSIVVKEETVINLCHLLQVSYFGESNYRKYKFLYSMQRGVYIELLDKKIMIFDRLCCKSKFEKSFIPLDRSIQAYANNEKIKKKESKLIMAGKRTKLIYVICNAMFNKNGFEKQDCNYIMDNKEFLTDKGFESLLEKIFFGYTDDFIGLLKNGDFDQAYDNYVKYKNY